MPFNLPIPDISFEQAQFSEHKEELASLLFEHWWECTSDRSVSLDLDWSKYELLEEAGAAVCIIARRCGHAIGYAVFLVFTQMHHAGRLVAESDLIFITAEERRGWAGVKLLHEVERLLEARGVVEIYGRTKVHVRGRHGFDLSSLFTWLKYHPAEMAFRKRVG